MGFIKIYSNTFVKVNIWSTLFCLKKKEMTDISIWFINEDFCFFRKIDGNWGIMYILTYWKERLWNILFKRKKNILFKRNNEACLFGISLVLRRFVLISHWTNQIFHRKSGHAPIVVKFELLCVSEFIWVLLTTRPILLTIRSTKSQHFIDSCVMNTLSRLGLLETRCL